MPSLTHDNPQGLSNAVVTVRDEAGAVVGKPVTSSARGEYWKLLLPGKYTVTRIEVYVSMFYYFAQVSASYDLCSTAGFVLESEAVRVSLSEEGPLDLVNIELVSVNNKCADTGPR